MNGIVFPDICNIWTAEALEARGKHQLHIVYVVSEHFKNLTIKKTKQLLIKEVLREGLLCL